MTSEKILEIARRFDPYEPDFVMTEDSLIAFAQAIIEERESIGEPVAWIDHEGGLYHYKLYETYLPLYRHPPHKRKLTDEEIKTLWVENLITVSEEQGYIRFARAIERRINGEEE